MVEQLQSKFNSAMLDVMRLAKLREQANYHSEQGDLDNWRPTLLSIYREVFAKLNDEQRKEGEQLFRLVAEKTQRYNLFNNQTQGGYPKAYGELWNVLHQFELWLRVMIEKTGLGIPNKEDLGTLLGAA